MVENFDPTTLADEGVRQVVIYLMNVVETQQATIQKQAEAIQHLHDESNRLKGEQGKPKIKATKPARDQSSENERRECKPPHKENKQAKIRSDRVEVVKGDQRGRPPDAQFKGYEEVIVQDVELRTETIKFCQEKYYSPSHRQTDLADLPAGSHGQFGPGVRAWVVARYDAGGMSEPNILERLETGGMHSSRGQISDLLITDQEPFHRESVAVVRAGLASSPWQHLDRTGTRVTGKNEHCHVLCNPFSTASCTLPSKDRLSLLRVLMGGTEPAFRLNELAFCLLPPLGVAPKWCKQLKLLVPHEQECHEAQLDALLDEHLPTLRPSRRKLIKDGLAIAAYRPQTAFPVVELLICDDAPPFNWLTVE
jgi:hypothetical protein